VVVVASPVEQAGLRQQERAGAGRREPCPFAVARGEPVADRFQARQRRKQIARLDQRDPRHDNDLGTRVAERAVHRQPITVGRTHRCAVW
jgi:hypothetical protein